MSIHSLAGDGRHRHRQLPMPEMVMDMLTVPPSCRRAGTGWDAMPGGAVQGVKTMMKVLSPSSWP